MDRRFIGFLAVALGCFSVTGAAGENRDGSAAFQLLTSRVFDAEDLSDNRDFAVRFPGLLSAENMNSWLTASAATSDSAMKGRATPEVICHTTALPIPQNWVITSVVKRQGCTAMPNHYFVIAEAPSRGEGLVVCANSPIPAGWKPSAFVTFNPFCRALGEKANAYVLTRL